MRKSVPSRALLLFLGFFLGATPGPPADSETAPRSAGTESMLSPGKKGPNTGRLAGWQAARLDGVAY